MVPASFRRPAALLAILAVPAAVGCFAAVNAPPGSSAAHGEVFKNVVALSDEIDDPAEWGKNYPYHYEDFQRTTQMQPTKYGGSTEVKLTPTAEDPRTNVSKSKLEADPRLKVLWAGYAFSKDYTEARGHAYMLDDQSYTRRQAANPPGACVNCHSSTVKAFLGKGGGDLTKGFEAINPLPYKEARTHVKHAITCLDCHDPGTMKLRITRPAFMEGIKAYKASQGVANYDVNKDATEREMKSFVCAQCHVTYYFKGAEKRLTFPWAKGLGVEEIYQDETGVTEWTHPRTGAKAIKPRHPEFEVWSKGPHAGVATCAECHMGKKTVLDGKVTITDHHINSPLLKIKQACLSCHGGTDAERKARVEVIQDNYAALRDRVFDQYIDLVDDISKSSASVTATALAQAQELQREGQFYLDFTVSENSHGFHAPVESTRILNLARDRFKQAKSALHAN